MIDSDLTKYGRERYDQLLAEAEAERKARRVAASNNNQPLKAMLDKVSALFTSDEAEPKPRTATQELRRVNG